MWGPQEPLPSSPIGRPEGTRGAGPLVCRGGPARQARASGWAGRQLAGSPPLSDRPCMDSKGAPPLAHPLSRPLLGGTVQPMECQLPAPHTPGGSADPCRPPFAHLSSLCDPVPPSALPPVVGRSLVSLGWRLMVLWDKGAPRWQGRAACSHTSPPQSRGRRCLFIKAMRGPQPLLASPPPSADHCPEKVLQPQSQMDVGFIS